MFLLRPTAQPELAGGRAGGEVRQKGRALLTLLAPSRYYKCSGVNVSEKID